jgi:hypothetical protein
VHPTPGSLRVFKPFSWLEVDSGKTALSLPAQPPRSKSEGGFMLHLRQNPLFKKVHSQYSKVENFLDRKIPLATVASLLLLKLYALPSPYRRGNFARAGIYEHHIATLLHDYRPDMSHLMSELSQYVNENEMAKIKSVVTDIRNRIKRFKNESSE